jgi:site-specific DNA recombinase
MDDKATTDYDGCGRCLVGVRRPSRKTDKTSSPARQADQVLAATADVGGTSWRGPMTGRCPGRGTR